jgi:hypothetical protein
MLIAFYTTSIHVRGSCTALYDYALYNETLLGNKSVIISNKGEQHLSDVGAVKKFTSRFPILYHTTMEDLEEKLIGCDMLYVIKHGQLDKYFSKTVNTAIHCVFDMASPHGHAFAAVSKTLAAKFGSTAFVPHMIALEPAKDPSDNLREQLGIPKHAVVFGRHGGMDTFDLELARKAISRVVRDFFHVHIVLVNTPVFDTHPSIHYLPMISGDDEKNRFIMTCDAHIECGSLGHTFGLSMAEFSVNNKPIIAYNGPTWNTAHLDILGDNGIYYKSEDELYKLLSDFHPSYYNQKDNNMYKEFTPENVMKQFHDVFIVPCTTA